MKYETIEVVFISHDTEAKEVEEKEFFTVATSGGTMASSALRLAHEIIDKRFHPSMWNIYFFQCTDGDNFPEDNEQFMVEARKLVDVAQLYGYCEIEPDASWIDGPGKLFFTTEPLQGPKMKRVRIKSKDKVWPAFRELMGGSVAKEGKK